ncbi:MAG: hypothetical protein Q4G21_06560 [Dermabacter sp.]|nr:hypothetical protein [Dermabacter sp.]
MTEQTSHSPSTPPPSAPAPMGSPDTAPAASLETAPTERVPAVESAPEAPAPVQVPGRRARRRLDEGTTGGSLGSGEKAPEAQPTDVLASLPNFAQQSADEQARAASSAETEAAGAALARHEAEDFARLSEKEHRSNLVSLALVLFSIPALFFTLWLPLGETSFAETNPTLATISGIGVALAFIVAGLVVHFAPRARANVLSRVEAGALSPSEESREVAEQVKASTRTRSRLLVAGGVLFALAAVVSAGFAVSALGDASRVFLMIAVALTFVVLAFSCWYLPFTTKRTVTYLSR